MRILIVNTSEKTGGAAVAAHRLMNALNNNGEKAKMLVRDKQTEAVTVASLPQSFCSRWSFLWERLVIALHLRFGREHLFEIDIANAGADITRTREFQEADIVHLHWINQGMLSLRGLRKILKSGKPVVWTMHDIWPATAICHYARGCHRFETHCSDCRLLPGGGSASDLSAAVWRQKKRLLADNSIFFVACSKWLAGEAKRSALLKGQSIRSIPNPIDVRSFRPVDKQEACRAVGLPEGKRVVLFVSQRVTDSRKGMDYFIEAVRLMAESHPGLRENTVIAVLGGHSEDVAEKLALPVFPLGYVGDEKHIVNVYNAADLFVLPSLEDNLPNTIMEAMACGVPCVGFKVGGIPEMIDHLHTGYVAAFRDASDLAKGMRWVLDEADRAVLSRNAVHKVNANYSQTAVAMRYIEVYNQAVAQKHYRL
jgi:glycosyltransferase involved in cell wall biosynthesis